MNSTANNCLMLGNTCVTAASDGIHVIANVTRTTFALGNLITDNGAYGIYAVDAAAGVFACGNRYDRNTSGATNGATDWISAFAGFNNTASVTAANEYENSGADDYRLKVASPALSAGVPLYRDIGALQRIRDYPAASSVLDSDTVDGAVGTIATRTLSPANDTVAAGYYAATTLHAEDADLAVGNIVAGKTIFGFAGEAAGGGGGGMPILGGSVVR